MNITRLREEYAKASLDEGDAATCPYVQFGKWFDEALKARVALPNAMTLATSNLDHGPSARIVLLKGFDTHGFVFFTNYNSRKGRELAGDNRAALVFFWSELERQVRIEGTVSMVDAAESDEYFATRPLGSRLGAWASPQSQPLPDRATLERKLEEVTRRHGDQPSRPPHWGGYRLKPSQLEFWQGRPSRLHDRLSYAALPGGDWKIQRLAP